ncbi:hypothetical protein KAR91_59515, partial [Candidatus Pacearchaeota archaeon]|nr:hypothetical protein [Candidatus Pacearchaeota archaeon]
GTGEDSDMQEKRETKDVKNVDVLTGRETDVEDEQHDRDPGGLSVTENKDSDMREKRKDWNLSQSTVDDISLDHQEKSAAAESDTEASTDVEATTDIKSEKTCDKCSEKECTCKEASAVDVKKHASRLERLYSKRLESKKAELDKEKQEFVNVFKDRFVRAMKIVARRQALNLEHSPIKEAFGVALCNPRSLGDGYDYEPMDEHLATHLVEAAFDEPLIEGVDKSSWEAFIDGLFDRTASIMEMSDESLMQIETDLQNMQAALVPVESNIPVSPRTIDTNLRQAANAGNLQLNPSGSENIDKNPDKKRASIRQAVGTTKVASSRSSLGI